MLFGQKVRQIGGGEKHKESEREERAKAKGRDLREEEGIQRTHLVQINMMNGTEQQLLLCCYFLLFDFCAPFYHKVISKVSSFSETHTQTPTHLLRGPKCVNKCCCTTHSQAYCTHNTHTKT